MPALDARTIKAFELICPGRVDTDPARTYAYAFDASHHAQRNPRPPLLAVMPASTAEVRDVVNLAASHGLALVPRGAGTGQTAGAVPAGESVVVDMSSMNAILKLDLDALQVVVQAGVIPEDLNRALEPDGFFFPPDPGSMKMCTLGGMIGNNASGMRAVKYGTTRNYVLGLEVVLADGSIIWTGGKASRALKSVSGYDLTSLLVGSEGTLGIITAARLRVAPLPSCRGLIMAYYDSVDAAGEAVRSIFRAGMVPSALELMDRTALSAVRAYRPDLEVADAEAVLIIEVDGLPAATAEAAQRIAQILGPAASGITHSVDEQEVRLLWEGRRAIGPASGRLGENTTRVSAGEDIGVPMDMVPATLRAVHQILCETGVPAPVYGHIGDGNLHIALRADPADEDSIGRAETAAHRLHLLALEMNGTTTAEHGVGLSRAPYMQQEHGAALDVMKSIKRALDPQNIMNPGKMGL